MKCFSAILLLLLSTATGIAWCAEAQPSVLVKTVPLHKERVTSSLTCYGVVSADPRSTVSVSLKRTTRVSCLLATQGEVVAAGAPLADVVTDSAESLNYEQAALSVDYARRDLARVESMAAQRLATQSQLDAARKTLADAEATLREQKRLGSGRIRERLKAPFAGTVTLVAVKEGDRVPAGTALMQISRQGALRAELGVEPEDVGQLKKGMEVLLSPVFGGSSTLAGTIHEIHGVINPQTRLVDVIVSLAGRKKGFFLSGIQVRGVIRLSSHTGWVVPRQAVLSDDKGEYVFQVDKGRARRVDVVGSRAGKGLVEVQGALNPNQEVVSLGNYELSDGMAVREAKGQ